MRKVVTIAGAGVILVSIAAASLYYASSRKGLGPVELASEISSEAVTTVEPVSQALASQDGLSEQNKDFAIQIAALGVLEKAQKMTDQLKSEGFEAYIFTEGTVEAFI